MCVRVCVQERVCVCTGARMHARACLCVCVCAYACACVCLLQALSQNVMVPTTILGTQIRLADGLLNSIKP